MYNNVVPHLSAVSISCNHSITRIISFTKNGSKQRSIVSVYGPCRQASYDFFDLLPHGFVRKRAHIGAVSFAEQHYIEADLVRSKVLRPFFFIFLFSLQ
jgi:hypothetical protein